MIARKLNGLIRNASPLKVKIRCGPDDDLKVIDIEITKQSILNAVKEALPEGGETGLFVDEEGYLHREPQPE